MKIVILLSILGIAAATHQGALLVDLDKNSVDGRHYDIEEDGTLQELRCRDCRRRQCRSWTTSCLGRPNSAHVFDNDCYFIDDVNPLTCTNDVDKCTEGFSLLATVTPERPNPGQPNHWLLSLGSSDTQEFGIKVGFQRAQVIVHVIGSEWKYKFECKLPENALEEECYTLGVVRGPRPNGPLRVFVDGERLDDCIEHVNMEGDEVDDEDKNAEVVVGAARELGALLEDKYSGLTNQICFFHRPVTLVEQATARESGCFEVGLDS